MMKINGMALAAADDTINYGTGVIAFPRLAVGDQVIVTYQFDINSMAIRTALATRVK